MRLVFASLLMLCAVSPALAQEPFGLRAGLADDNAPEQATAVDTTATPVEDTAAPVDETATASIPRRTIGADEDPYAALGIRAGSFILYPSLTASTGYTTNASGAAGGAGSGSATLTPELLIQSDWARHEATVKLRGSYEKFFDGVTADNPDASADATARIDFADDWTADLAAGYNYSQQAISDPSFPAGADKPPGVHGLNGSAALNGNFGRGVFTVEGSADRAIYENATSGGAPVDQGDRTNTLFAGRLRLGYEATASLTPFVEGEISRRLYDRPIDNGGLRRSSTGLAYRAGVEFDRGPLLRGEIAVGGRQEDFDDATLATLQALTVDGSLVWTPTQLTTVTFDGSTTLDPSADPASSGSVVYGGSVDIAYAWRRNFTFDWTAGIRHERFEGINQIDTTYNAGLAATWKINRTLHLTARYVHEWLDSNTAGRGFQSDAVRLELRVQR